MKLFNLGRGMSLHYQVKENKPDGWPDSISLEDFKGVSFAKKEEATQIIEALIRYYAKVEPDDDVVSSEDEVIENVEDIVNDVKQQWIKGEIYVGYLNMLLVILVILVIFLNSIILIVL